MIIRINDTINSDSLAFVYKYKYVKVLFNVSFMAVVTVVGWACKPLFRTTMTTLAMYPSLVGLGCYEDLRRFDK